MGPQEPALNLIQGGPIRTASASRSGGGSGARPMPRLRPGPGDWEKPGPQAARRRGPNFPFRHAARIGPCPIMRHYRTFPCPGARRFALRVYITRVLCKLRDAAPAQLSAGALTAAPPHPSAEGRPGSAVSGLRASQPGIISTPSSLQSCRASRPARAPPGPGRPWCGSGFAASPAQWMRGHSRPCPRSPWPWGSARTPPRSSRSRVRSFALTSSRGPPWSAVRCTALRFPPHTRPLFPAQASGSAVARPPTGTEGTPRRLPHRPCPKAKKKNKKG